MVGWFCWRRFALLGLITYSILALCQAGIHRGPGAHHATKQQAVEMALQAQSIIGKRISGPEYTMITTTLGQADAKRLSLHPDFAAVIVDLLIQAKVGKGDRVAVNLSGSFPALNIAALAAVQALGAEPVITSSVGASSWGATDPDFTWLDMEKTLAEAHLWPWRSAAVSIGGVGDRGGGLSNEGLDLARLAIERSGVHPLHAKNLDEAIVNRLDIYRQNTGRLPSALLNVGGNHVIFGHAGHKAPLKEGLTEGFHLYRINDGLALPFVKNGLPVVHILNVNRMAAKYGIKNGAPPGTSKVFYTTTLAPGWKAIAWLWLGTVTILLWQGRKKGWWNGPCR